MRGRLASHTRHGCTYSHQNREDAAAPLLLLLLVVQLGHQVYHMRHRQQQIEDGLRDQQRQTAAEPGVQVLAETEVGSSARLASHTDRRSHCETQQPQQQLEL